MDESNSQGNEVSPKEIFEMMKKNIYDNFLRNSSFSINKEYIFSRKNLFAILHKINSRMGFKSQTFFLCTHFLDIIFTKKKRINCNLNTLGVASLCLAAKYCENDPIVPHLQYFIKIYNYIVGYKNIISMSDLLRTEVIVLKLLNYKLNYFTIYDFNSFLFGHGILKIEQLKDLDNKNKRLYQSKRKEFTINSTNSIMIKNILEKIYKKSRYYLDIITNNTKLCFKYNPLIISIFIMKKSVEEILANEKRIHTCDKEQKEEFYENNNSCFKQIMLNFYKVDYEASEEYKELIIDEEIVEIFGGKEKNEEDPAPSADKKINLKEKVKEKNNILDLDLNNNININEEMDNRTIFTSSASNGFYNRLKLKTNLEDLNKKQNANERITVSSREENTISNMSKKKFDYNNSNNENIENNNNIEHIENNLNINEIRKSYRKKETNYINKTNIKKNIKSKNKEEELTNNKNKYIISINNRYIPNPDIYNSIKNNSITHKNYLNNFNLTYTINENRGKKFNLNKKKTHRSQYSYNLLDKDNNLLNSNIENSKKRYEKKPYYRKLIHQNTIDILNSNFNDSNINSTNRDGISSYYIPNKFNSEVNMNKNNKNNETEINSFNRNNIDINKKSIVSKINSFYIRIREKNKSNDLTNKTIDISEDLNKNINNLNELKNQVTTTSSRFRRRLYNSNKNFNNNNIINKDMSSEIPNTNSVIIKDMNKKEIESYNQSNSNKNNNGIFYKLKENNIFKRKNKIYSFNTNNSNNTNINDKNEKNDLIDDKKSATASNFYKNSTNLNKISVNTSKKTDNRNPDINISYKTSKRISYILAKKNSELNKTLKEINKISAKNNGKKYEKFINSRNIKEKEKDMSVQTINTLNTKECINKNNNDFNKIYKSIRLKYLEIKKNLNNNSNINIHESFNNKYSKTMTNFNKKGSASKKIINVNNGLFEKNIIINPKKPRHSFINKNNNKIESNTINNKTSNNCSTNTNSSNVIKNNSSTNNNNSLPTRVTEMESKNKNISESSIYKLINKTKTLFTKSINKEEDLIKLDRKLNNNNNNDNSTEIKFYKTHQNFYKHLKTNDNNNKIEKDEKIIQNDTSSKLDTTYFSNIINKNNLNKNNSNTQIPKNSSTIVINNNININIGNKTNNINNEYVQYKNVYKKSNIPELNFSKTLSNNNFNNNDGLINKNNSNRNMNNSNMSNVGSTFSNILHKFSFYRKNLDKSNNSINNNIEY